VAELVDALKKVLAHLVTMTSREMNQPSTTCHWLEHSELNGEDALVGNRAGFELLRQSVDQLLAGTTESFLIDGDEVSLKQLKLCEPPPPSAPESFREKLITFALVFLFLISIPLLALFGLYQLIQILFS
jgi:hypothetical protein